MRIFRLALIALFAFALAMPVAAQRERKAAAPPAAQKKAPPAAAAPATGDLIDVNAASEEQLRTLPGIGAAFAARIIKNRPYRGKNEIVSKAGVPQATYDKIKDKIVARQK